MRCVRALLWILAVIAVGAGRADATSVTVLMSGTWDSVVDNASVTNGTMTAGSAFTATLVFDDGASDLDVSPNVGDYLLPAASTSLVLSSGSYSFTLLATSSISLGIDDNVGGQDGFGFFTEFFSASGPLAAGASTGYGYANPALFDSTQAAHSSDDLTALPWDASAYDNTNFYFLIEVLGKGADKYIELSGTITELSVLPEPSTLALLGLVVSALAVHRSRG